MKYKILFVRAAQKEFSKIPRTIQKKLAPKISNLENGLNNNCKKLSSSDSLYRLRVGQYRIVFELQEKKLVILVLRVGHRQSVYRKMR